MDTRQIAINGAKWTSAATVSRAIVELLKISILTRFLDEKDFGIVAIITFVSGLIQCFSDLGFSTAIMHKRDLNREEFSSLYWIQFFLYLVLFVVGSTFSKLVAYFYDEKSIIYLLPISLMSLVLMGIGQLYDTVFQKNMEYKILAIRNLVATFFSLIIAVWLAYVGMGVYSLVFSILSHTTVVNLWNFIAGQRIVKIRLFINIKSVIPLIKIGFYQTSTQILDYFGSKLDVLIIGKLIGTEGLGLYSLADTLLNHATYLTLSIANKVSLPIMSILQNDFVKMRSSYCNIIKIVTSINIPILMLLGVLSYPLVTIIYGEKYIEIAPIVSVLSIAYLGNCVCNPVGNLIIPTGRTDLAFYYTIVRLIVIVPIIYFFSMMGLTALAWGKVIINILIFFISWYIEIWLIVRLKLVPLIYSFARELLIGAICGVLGFFVVKDNILTIDSTYLQVCVYSIGIMILYVILQFIFNRKGNRKLYELVGR